MTVTQNIVFDATSSASYNAIGGIGKKNNLFGGDEDYYFSGTFDGRNHTISGFTATVPLFAATGSAGSVKDLTIDNTCSFSFTHPNSTELDAGATVGYHKGTLDNVSVEANVSLVAGEVSQETCLGGIVGRETVGTIKNCSYSGAITIPSAFKSSEKKIQVGGIVGRISNSDGKVQDTDFEGTIDNQGQMIAASESNDMKNNPQLMIGGIAGLNSGTVLNCDVAEHATGITVSLTDDSDASVNDYTGTIVTHSSNAYHYAMGGVVARNDGTVSSCTNNATVLDIFSAERGASGNMNGRYLEIGGIAGYNSSSKTITGCTNNGAIINRANPKIQYVGGLVGSNHGSVASSSNASTGAITIGTSHKTPYSARSLYCGGAIGYNQSTSSITNISNAANITVSKTEDVSATIVWVGGVAGGNEASIDGSVGGGTITNTGSITMTNPNTTKCTAPTESNDYGFFLGGIVAKSTVGIANVSNSGNLTYNCTAAGVGVQYVYLGGVVARLIASSSVNVDKCTNSGNVTFDPTTTAPHANSSGAYYNFCYLGGIAGYAKNANIIGDSTTKCTNSGNVYGGDGSGNYNSGTPQNSFWVGGIVGYLTGASSLDYCELVGTGQSYNNHWSNRGTSWGSDGTIGSSAYSDPAPIGAGIAAQVVGTSSVKIPISNCAVASTATINGRRGARGGIVGISQYATISSCTVPVRIQGGYWCGGIVALAYETSFSSCSYTGSRVDGTNEGGGIAAFLGTGSSILSCSSSASTLSATYKGGIAGASVAGTSIKKSHYKSTVQICGDSNFTAGTGEEANAADL